MTELTGFHCNYYLWEDFFFSLTAKGNEVIGEIKKKEGRLSVLNLLFSIKVVFECFDIQYRSKVSYQSRRVSGATRFA